MFKLFIFKLNPFDMVIYKNILFSYILNTKLILNNYHKINHLTKGIQILKHFQNLLKTKALHFIMSVATIGLRQWHQSLLYCKFLQLEIWFWLDEIAISHIKLIFSFVYINCYILINFSFQLSHTDKCGQCPAVHAAMHGHLESLAFLLQCDWSSASSQQQKIEAMQQAFVAAAAMGHKHVSVLLYFNL